MISRAENEELVEVEGQCCMPSPGNLVHNESTEPVQNAVSLLPIGGNKHVPISNSSAHEFVPIGPTEFLMGNDVNEGYPGDGEGPRRRVQLSKFDISAHTVSNAQFACFVSETNYVTQAEKYGWSFVFHLLLPEEKRVGLRTPAGLPWWLQVEGAFWAKPEGSGSDIKARADHPVTHISWLDAKAYCEWSGTRLPSEAEWECAARGGLESARFAWGDCLEPDGSHQCNIWQGEFPTANSEADGYLGTAPVDAYSPNAFGLYNVCGNVWEWCEDWFSPNYHRVTREQNPIYLVPGRARSMRGGSFMCHESWCNRYRVAARSSNAPDSSTSHCGFRVVRCRDDIL